MPPAADSPQVRLTIPARAEYVALLRLALSAVARLTPLSGEEVADLKLAVDEAASRWVPPAPVLDEAPDDVLEEPATGAVVDRLAVRYGLDPDQLLLEVACRGPEVMSVAERELSLAILRATADECHAEPGRIRLVKYLGPGTTVG